MKIKVTADSICDLSPELLKQYDIPLAPLSVLVDEAEYHDGVDITPDMIYDAVDHNKHVHSAAVNVAEYEELFRRVLKDYDAIIHFTIGSSFSACYTNACTAAEMVGGNIYVVDSENLTTGCGHLVLDACEMAAQGMEPQAIVDAVKKTIPNIDTSFVVSTIDYLYKGGRVTGMAAVGAKLLNIRPSIELANGIMQPGKKYRGNINRVLDHYIDDRLANVDDIDTSRVFISFSKWDDGVVASVHEKVAQMLPGAKIYETMVGSTISVHCGPGTLGVVLKRKSAKKG